MIDSRPIRPGPEVEAFERDFARYLGTDHVIGVGNGTDAITIALRAMGVGPGDDVDRAVVHLLRQRRGHPGDRRAARCSAMSTPRRFCVTRRHGARRADPEDQGGARRPPVRQRRAGRRRSRRSACRCSRTRPRRLGSQGRSTAVPARSARPRTFSFFPSKNLGAFGDGGAITTSDAELAERVTERCASTARATRLRSTRSATTRGSTRSRRRSCASSSRTSTAGLTAAEPPPAPTERAGLGELVALPQVTRGSRPGVASVRRADEDRRVADRRAERTRRSAPEAYYRGAHSTTAGDVRVRAHGSRCPGPRRAAPTNLAIPMQPGARVRRRERGRPGRSRPSRRPGRERLTAGRVRPHRRVRRARRAHARRGGTPQLAHLGALLAVVLVALLERGDPARQPADRVGDRVGQVDPVGVRALGRRPSTRTG